MRGAAGQVSPEFLRSQIEVGLGLRHFGEARADFGGCG
jgi:hypothetical protein